MIFAWLLCLGLMCCRLVSANPQCRKENLDIFIALDGSQSVHPQNFNKLRQFLSNLVGEFKIGEFQSRIGLMQFSNKFRTVVEFDFGRHKTTKGIQNNIKRLVHQYGDRTFLGHAFRVADKHIFSDNSTHSDREDSEKVLLLITDGQPHDPEEAIEEANKLKSKGVHLITIGAGTKKWISKHKLLFNRIGSKPAHNHIEDFRFLKKITKKLVKDICGNKERQPAPEHKCFQEKKDILIMVDGSKSVGSRMFYKIRFFLQDFLSRVDVGPSRVHVGVMQFSDRLLTSIEVSLNQFSTLQDLVATIAKLRYQGGKEADLYHALQTAHTEVFKTDHGDRVSAPDTIIIFTDGNYISDGVQEIISKFQKKDIRVVAVTVGHKKKINHEMIESLVMGPSDVYDFEKIESSVFVDDIAPSTCKMATCTSTAPICHPENQDILFLVDGSSRIGRTEFIAGQRFIKRLVEKMTIGKNTTHVGIMQFGSAGRVEHATRLGSGNVRSTVSNDVSKMVYMNERYDSDLGYALSIASDMLLNPQNVDRKSVAKTIVLMTDGDVTNFYEVNTIAEKMRKKDIRIITMSNGVNSKFQTFVSSLRILASGSKKYYRVDSSQFNEVLAELEKTVCISEPEIPETCFSQKRRIFFALDSSSGRNKKKFKELQEFLESLINKLQVGFSGSQVGFLQFDDLLTSENRVIFKKDATMDEILEQIRTMQYRKARLSYLGNALKIINNRVFAHGRERHGETKDVLIIITHKEINDEQLAFDEAEKLKSKGVQIISIASGRRSNVEKIKSQLRVISTEPTNTHAADYFSLWTVVDDVIVSICGLGQCTSFMARTCAPKKQDIVFLIDSSRSIGKKNYRRLQRFMNRLALRLDLAEDRTHLGVLQAGGRDGSRFQFNLGDFPDRSDILYMINDMEYIDSLYTYMGEGLTVIREKVFNHVRTDRPHIPNTLVIFADGESHDDVVMLKEAEQLKSMGVKILSVGYGTNISFNSVGMSNLKKMASSDVFNIDFERNDLILEEKIDLVAKHLVEVDCPRAYPSPVKCNQGKVDLFLLVDGSRSISSKNFKLVKKFLRRLTSEFDVSEKAAHVGLLQFSDEKSMSYEFALNEMHNKKEVRKAIRRMKYRAGLKTNTGDALRIVDQYIFNHRNGDRPDAADVLILFTDGRAHDFKLAKKHAARMKKRNIKIITIAAGHEAKNPKAKLVKQLEEIASDPLNVYKVDFSELGEITDRLIHVDCVIVPQEI